MVHLVLKVCLGWYEVGLGSKVRQFEGSFQGGKKGLGTGRFSYGVY